MTWFGGVEPTSHNHLQSMFTTPTLCKKTPTVQLVKFRMLSKELMLDRIISWLANARRRFTDSTENMHKVTRICFVTVDSYFIRTRRPQNINVASTSMRIEQH